jgi:membrane-bound lytic murein transglycosylase D
MRRWLTGLATCLAACGGRTVATEQPSVRAPESAPPVTLPAEPVPAPVAGQISSPSDSVAPSPATAARDSAADAAALDSLGRAQPAASLPDVPIESKATWDLDVANFAEQPRVKYYLDYFVGRAHDRFQVWLQRMGRYESYARAQFVARKLPGDFVYLALIESGYSPEAVSRARAVGIWQFMLGTGKLFGLRADTWLDERRDPIKATDAAAHYLEDLSQRFGSHYLAAAAYNAGAGRVGRGLVRMNAQGSSDDDSIDVTSDEAFFSLADTRTIRDETKNYVPQLIAAAILAKEPAKYGFDVSSHVVPFSLDSVMVDGGTGLDLIARLADTTLDALRDLNPHLLRLITPPGERYPVRVPTGSADRVASAYAALSADDRRAVTPHQVKRGETVATLSRRFGASADLIRQANRAARAKALVPGTVIYIPVATTTIPASFLREPDPPRTTRTITRTYVVRAGESITAVARRAGVSVAALRSGNHLGPKAILRAGQRLVVHRTVTATIRHRTRLAASQAAGAGRSQNGGRTDR